jgi:hypothetical protein
MDGYALEVTRVLRVLGARFLIDRNVRDVTQVGSTRHRLMGAATKPLHMAPSLKVVAKHKHTPGISIDLARDIIQDLAKRKTLTRGRRAPDRGSRRAHRRIDHRAGELTKEWPPKG